MMNNPIYKIQINDLTIRCGEKSDAVAQKETIDSSLKHLHEFMPWSHHEPETIQQKEERLFRWKQDYIDNKDYSVVVFRDSKMIASAGLHNRLNRNALEIGYWVRADEINKGIATKISLALTILAIQFIEVEEVEIRHNIKNVASSKIPLKLKYKKLDNYIDKDDNIENGRWIIDQSIFDANTDLYLSLYNKISFYAFDGKKVEYK